MRVTYNSFKLNYIYTEDYSREDLARAVIGLVMSDAASWIESNAVAEKTTRVFLIGGVVQHPIIANELIKQLYSQRWYRAKVLQFNCNTIY